MAASTSVDLGALTQGQHASNLAAELLFTQFGEVVEVAAGVLAAYGPLDVQGLARRLPEQFGSPKERWEHAQGALTVLLQHRCAHCRRERPRSARRKHGAAAAEDPPRVTFTLDVPAVLERARFPWFMSYVERVIARGGGAAAVRAKGGGMQPVRCTPLGVRMVLRCLIFRGRSSWDKVLEDTARARVDAQKEAEQHGGQEVAVAEDAELLPALYTLVAERLVQRSPRLVYDEVEREEEFHTKGSKKAKEAAAENRRRERAGRHDPQRFKIAAGDREAAAALANKPADKVAKAGSLPKPAPSVMWTINWAEFNHRMLIELTADLVDRAVGNEEPDPDSEQDSPEMDAWRWLAAAEPKASVLPTDEDEDDETGPLGFSARLTEAELVDRMKSQGYKKLAVTRALKNLTDAYPVLVTRSEDVDGQTRLCADVKYALAKQRRRFICNVVRSTFAAEGSGRDPAADDERDQGEAAARIIAMLLEKGHMEIKQISDTAMLKMKDARQLLYRMVTEGFLAMNEVQRGTERQPNRSIFLWYVNEDQLVKRVGVQCLHTLVALYRAERKLWEDDTDVIRAIDATALSEDAPPLNDEHMRIINKLTEVSASARVRHVAVSLARLPAATSSLPLAHAAPALTPRPIRAKTVARSPPTPCRRPRSTWSCCSSRHAPAGQTSTRCSATQRSARRRRRAAPSATPERCPSLLWTRQRRVVVHCWVEWANYIKI